MITGPSRHIRQLADSLSKQGHDVVVICEKESNQASRKTIQFMASGIKIVQLRGIGTGHQMFLMGLMRTVRDEHPNIVHAQGYRSTVTDMSSIAAVANGIPFVLTARGSLLGFLRRNTDSMTPVAARLYDFVTLKQTLRLSSAVVVTCDQEGRDAISMGIDAKKIRLIPHGMVFPAIPTGICSLKGWPRILTVSRITPHRNIVDIIRSIRIISEVYPDVVLYIAGDSIPSSYDSTERTYPRDVARAIREEGIEEHVRLLGGVYGEELWNLYASCDLFVYASSYDNFGFALLEASYFGLPLVSTEVGIAGDLIQSGKGGILLTSHDPTSIARATIDILNKPAELARMSEHMKENARNYSIHRNLMAHIQMYEELSRTRV